MVVETDRTGAARYAGLTSEQVLEQRKKHGPNVLTPPRRDPWWRQFLEKFDDPVIRILMIAAVLAIIVGIFEGNYFEGVGIIAAIMLATTIAFYNEFKAGKEFDVLNRSSDQKPIKALRDDRWMEVERKDLVVGDIIQLEQGYEVPADGAVLQAVCFQVDQAVLTGESVPVTKVAHPEPGEQQYALNTVFRGTKVAEGTGVVRIERVGDATEWGKLGKEISEDIHVATPLDQQLEKLSKLIGVVGFSVAGLIFVALAARDLVTGEVSLLWQQWVFTGLLLLSLMVALVRVWLPIFYDACELMGRAVPPPEWLEDESLSGWGKTLGGGAGVFVLGLAILYLLGWVPPDASDWIPLHFGMLLLEYFMIAVTIIVVAVPEGLAMSVTLSLAYSMRRMMRTGTLIRKMSACETIGAVTVICSDKTGTLTRNEMHTYEIIAPCINTTCCGDQHGLECPHSRMCRSLLVEAFAANTTAHLDRPPDGRARAIGNPTEGALLLWLESQGVDYMSMRESFQLETRLPFDTRRKFMATAGISLDSGERHLHIKGAPEIVLARCTRIQSETGERPLTETERIRILESLNTYQKRGFRALGFAYRKIGRPLAQGELEGEMRDLVWLRFVAIEDPVRDEVHAAVDVCRTAGIEVKMVTGDHPETAEEIARRIGLLMPGESGRHMSGADFEKMSDEAAAEAARSICVLSRARPEHKRRLVELLRGEGHVVAVSGDGVNDAPALKNASVALAMGSGTDVAKEVSQVVLLNDSFATIKSAVMWGRALYQNIQRFIVFQLTVNVAALTVAFLGPFIGVQIPLTVIQLLWVNLIMDTFAALALATQPPHEDIMRKAPRNPDAFIVTREMWRWILSFGFAFVALMVVALLHFRIGGMTQHELSLFFAMFVMLQFWNLFNARVFGLRQSAFKGVWENKAFVGIATAIFVGTIIMVQAGGQVFRTEPLSLGEWVFIIVGTSWVLWIGEFVRQFKA